ncbi:MAG: FAD-dependent oxidoreductase [Fidelibacterota bacterium]
MELPTSRLEIQFKEDKPVLTKIEAGIEANRCLFCYDAPCIKACPTGIDIPAFIRKIASGNLKGAAMTIFKSNLLGFSTGRVCPVDELCAGACVFNLYNGKPIQIGRLQHYAVARALQRELESGQSLFTVPEPGNRKVALVGAGPASLACAGYLALNSVKTVIYEKNDFPGGLNTTGIAPYKMPAPEALAEADWITGLGVEIHLGVAVGRDIRIDKLLADFDALFLGTGLGKDKFPGIPGEREPGVWGATELIRKIKNEPDFQLPSNLRTVVVIGGGNTAIDIARELALLGVPKVNIVYRRTEAEMPGYAHELKAARQVGVRLIEKIKPVQITSTPSGILEFHGIITSDGSPVKFSTDWIVMAIGQEKIAGRLIPEVKTDDKGRVVVDPETRQTSHLKIFAGGDCVNGGKEVVNAVADGRAAAEAMLKMFTGDH